MNISRNVSTLHRIGSETLDPYLINWLCGIADSVRSLSGDRSKEARWTLEGVLGINSYRYTE